MALWNKEFIGCYIHAKTYMKLFSQRNTTMNKKPSLHAYFKNDSTTIRTFIHMFNEKTEKMIKILEEIENEKAS